MSLFKKVSKTLKSSLTGWGKPHHGLTGGLLTRKQFKKLRSKIGLTSKNKLVRQVRRSLSGKPVMQPTSASSVDNGYIYNGRTISQLMGGH